MSLQKGFFNVEPFNPDPYWDNTLILNLSGAAKFEDNTVFPRGRYSIDVQAGGMLNYPSYKTGRIVQNISVPTPFIIRAYCGSGANGGTPGINPYTGIFKVNGRNDNTTIPDVNHIFGNAGSPGTGPKNYNYMSASSGNCLGDGAVSTKGNTASAAGSCLHLLPIGGTFGIDYLFAFHTTGRAVASSVSANSGSGGAFGGGASGSVYFTGNDGVATVNGGNTPYGLGGVGVDPYNAGIYGNGNDGNGIGAGHADQSGAAAWFNGTTWYESNATNTDGQGHIIVTYLGTL